MGETTSIGAVCNRNVACTRKSASVAEAAQIMRERHVGSLVVIEDGAAGPVPMGVLTDRDIVISVVARGGNPGATTVADVMSDSVLTVLADDSVNDALALMRRYGVRRVPVTSSDGVLYGIVSLDDLLQVAVEELRGFVQTIESAQWRETSQPAARG